MKKKLVGMLLATAMILSSLTGTFASSPGTVPIPDPTVVPTQAPPQPTVAPPAPTAVPTQAPPQPTVAPPAPTAVPTPSPTPVPEKQAQTIIDTVVETLKQMANSSNKEIVNQSSKNKYTSSSASVKIPEKPNENEPVVKIDTEKVREETVQILGTDVEKPVVDKIADTNAKFAEMLNKMAEIADMSNKVVPSVPGLAAAPGTSETPGASADSKTFTPEQVQQAQKELEEIKKNIKLADLVDTATSMPEGAKEALKKQLGNMTLESMFFDLRPEVDETKEELKDEDGYYRFTLNLPAVKVPADDTRTEEKTDSKGNNGNGNNGKNSNNGNGGKKENAADTADGTEEEPENKKEEKSPYWLLHFSPERGIWEILEAEKYDSKENTAQFATEGFSPFAFISENQAEELKDDEDVVYKEAADDDEEKTAEDTTEKK